VKRKDGTRSELAKRGVGGINRDVVVFTFFLFLSFVFWYLNSLGKDIETGIKYPIKYTNLPKERVIADDPQVRLTLYLKGTGSSILKLRLSGKKTPVEIDISKVSYKRMPGSRNPDYFIITSGLAKSLTIQMRSGCEITSIKPDTLFFTLEKTVTGSDQTTSDNIVERGRKRQPLDH
jgi:hypothetical protein